LGYWLDVKVLTQYKEIVLLGCLHPPSIQGRFVTNLAYIAPLLDIVAATGPLQGQFVLISTEVFNKLQKLEKH
jgi:hypothetical protein